MAQIKRRYTKISDGADYLVTVAFDDKGLNRTHWFEAKVSAQNEKTSEKVKFPPELATYRIGEVEHTVRQIITLDFGGDQESAVSHWLNTICRRVYAFIERGH